HYTSRRPLPAVTITSSCHPVPCRDSEAPLLTPTHLLFPSLRVLNRVCGTSGPKSGRHRLTDQSERQFGHRKEHRDITISQGTKRRRLLITYRRGVQGYLGTNIFWKIGHISSVCSPRQELWQPPLRGWLRRR